MRRVFISYAHEDKNFVDQLAATLREAEFEVWYDENIHPPEKWEGQLLDKMANWADFCVFVVSPAFNNSEYIHTKEKQWARIREVQLHRLFKFFVVKLESGCVSEDLARFQAANFIGWEQDQNYKRGWLQLSHHLHHHQPYPDLFVNREKESQYCVDSLWQSNTPGVLIWNKDGKRGMGNSMLLWHLEETCLPSAFGAAPHKIVPLDWGQIVQGKSPVGFLDYTVVLLRGTMSFSNYDKKLRELIEAGKIAREPLASTKSPHGRVVRPKPGMSGFTIEYQGRVATEVHPETYELSALTYLSEEKMLRKLTGAFLEDVRQDGNLSIVWLVNGPSESDWRTSLGQRYEWLKETFFTLSRIPNMWIIAAGTHPMLSPAERHGVPGVELDQFKFTDVERYVEKRLYGLAEPWPRAIIAQFLWDRTEGHPTKMYKEFDQVLRAVGRRMQ